MDYITEGLKKEIKIFLLNELERKLFEYDLDNEEQETIKNITYNLFDDLESYGEHERLFIYYHPMGSLIIKTKKD